MVRKLDLLVSKSPYTIVSNSSDFVSFAAIINECFCPAIASLWFPVVQVDSSMCPINTICPANRTAPWTQSRSTWGISQVATQGAQAYHCIMLRARKSYLSGLFPEKMVFKPSKMTSVLWTLIWLGFPLWIGGPTGMAGPQRKS